MLPGQLSMFPQANAPLVLSLFPGIGILDRAFEEHGFCVVRGPDLLWGDIKQFHPPAGRFDGVIGGSPCQCFSRLAHIVRHNGYAVGENLIPEFERVVREAQPTWFVMENVVGRGTAAGCALKVIWSIRVSSTIVGWARCSRASIV